MGRSSPGRYDEYLRAYSMAMLQRERENVSYGGKSRHHPKLLIVVSLWLIFDRSSYHAAFCFGKSNRTRPRIALDVPAAQSE